MQHGTHVAGISAGTTYGVAKNAKIIPVRVMDNSGSGTSAAIVAGINWVTRYSTSACPKKIMNFSLGSTSTVQSINNAITSALNSNVLAVVAAGNEQTNACQGSPANVAAALTVGATDAPAFGLDSRASYSNWGSCVDVFAPVRLGSVDCNSLLQRLPQH